MLLGEPVCIGINRVKRVHLSQIAGEVGQVKPDGIVPTGSQPVTPLPKDCSPDPEQ